MPDLPANFADLAARVSALELHLEAPSAFDLAAALRWHFIPEPETFLLWDALGGRRPSDVVAAIAKGHPLGEPFFRRGDRGRSAAAASAVVRRRQAEERANLIVKRFLALPAAVRASPTSNATLRRLSRAVEQESGKRVSDSTLRRRVNEFLASHAKSA